MRKYTIWKNLGTGNYAVHFHQFNRTFVFRREIFYGREIKSIKELNDNSRSGDSERDKMKRYSNSNYGEVLNFPRWGEFKVMNPGNLSRRLRREIKKKVKELATFVEKHDDVGYIFFYLYNRRYDCEYVEMRYATVDGHIYWNGLFSRVGENDVKKDLYEQTYRTITEVLEQGYKIVSEDYLHPKFKGFIRD